MQPMPHAIDVEAHARFVPEHSEPEDDHYVFAYTITITNAGDQPARLMTRHWVITDANGHVQEVKGEGVVGKQPHLAPGESFEYTSAAALATPNGTMEGSYQMEADDGTRFDAAIEPFALTKKDTLH